MGKTKKIFLFLLLFVSVFSLFGCKKKSYVVTLDPDGGICEVQSIEFESPGTALPVPSKEGFIFKGWYEGETKIEATKELRDYNLKAKWEEITHKITYDLDGGENAEGNPSSFKKSDLPIVLGNPSKEGFIFKGWYEGETKIEATTELRDYNLKAKWEEIAHLYTVTLDPDGGTCKVQSIKFDAPGATLPVPSKEGFIFKGWYEGETKIEATTELRDYHVKAKWEEIAHLYTVTLDPDGGTCEVQSIKFDAPGAALPVPSKEGFIFKGWYEGETKIEATKELRDYNLKAKWEEITHKITYDLDGGENAEENPSSFKKSDLPIALGNPSKEGFIFKGWFMGDSEVREIPEGTVEDITLTAHWEFLESLDLSFAMPDTMKAGETQAITHTLGEGSKNPVITYLSGDPEIATVDEKGIVTAVNDGTVIITITVSDPNHPERTKEYSLEFTISTVYRILYSLNGSKNAKSNPKKYSPSELPIVLKKPTKKDGIFEGWFLDDRKITEIPVGTKGDIRLVAKYSHNKITVGSEPSDQYTTIAAAVNSAQPFDTIYLKPGTYDEDVTLNVPELTIVSANKGINPNGSTPREPEAIFIGHMRIGTEARNLTIDGLAFTGDAYVDNNDSVDYQGFKFINNKVYNTTKTTEAYSLNSYETKGLVEFRLSGGGITENFQFINNRFENVSDVNILVNRVNNVLIEGNVFIDFDRDAIRIEGKYCTGKMYVINNHFEQTTPNHGYSAIFFYTLAGGEGSSTDVLVQGNTFKNCGSKDNAASPFNGTINSNVFQENDTTVRIKSNIFDHCLNLFWLRNNGGDAESWKCRIEDNQFLGIPKSFYYGSYKGEDNESTNPHLTEFGANYYEDDKGVVIDNLGPYSKKFKHLYTFGTCLTEKPEIIPAEPFKIYKIIYETDGGLIHDKLPYSYVEGMKEPIILPKNVIKENYTFVSWLLNDTEIDEIPVDATGDLVLKVKYRRISDEAYTVTYDHNDGYSTELLINNIGDAIEFYVDNYNYNNCNFWGGGYAGNIYIGDNAHDPTATFSERIYIGMDKDIGLYKVLKIQPSGEGSSWAAGAEYVITLSGSFQSNSKYASGGEARRIVKRMKVGQIVIFSKPLPEYTEKNPGIVYFFENLPESRILRLEKIRTSDNLIIPKRLGYQFDGWYDGETEIKELSQIHKDTTLKAKWVPFKPVTDIVIDNICKEMIKGETYQINATLIPSDAYFQDIIYESSNNDVMTVDSKGLIKAVNAGTAVITIHDYENKIMKYLRFVNKENEITVYPVYSLDVNFDDSFNGIMKPGDEIQMSAKAIGKGAENAVLKYDSDNKDVLTVSGTGLIKAKKEGEAVITVEVEGKDVKLPIVICVHTYTEDTPIDKLMGMIIANNRFVTEIGNISLFNDSTNRIYVPTYGSVNRYLFDEFLIDTQYYDQAEKTPEKWQERRPAEGEWPGDVIEFVTVHDTATLTGTVENIANTMSGGAGSTSINYTVGNGKIMGVVPEKYRAHHAADGTSAKFDWTKTNVPATDTVNAPEFGHVEDEAGKKWLTLNGIKSNVELPVPEGKEVKFTSLGPGWKVEDGVYLIGTLWYQSGYGVVASRGGNNNSIGIEMCSNYSGDMYDTFQRTSQLVADILIRNDLDPTRVKQHNTYCGKNCPQTILSGNYWSEFMKFVNLQYTIRKDYPEAKITITTDNSDILQKTGRITVPPIVTTQVSYTVTVTLGEETRTVKLYSIVPGSTSWEQWDGTYPSSVVWNNGKFALNK